MRKLAELVAKLAADSDGIVGGLEKSAHHLLTSIDEIVNMANTVIGDIDNINTSVAQGLQALETAELEIDKVTKKAEEADTRLNKFSGLLTSINE